MKRLILAAAFFTAKAFAGSVAGTGGATEVTQIMNNGQLMKQAEELMRQTNQLRDQLRKQTAMVDDMTRHGKSLSSFHWASVSGDLKDLSRVVSEGEALAYSMANIDVKYRQKYKGYDTYMKTQSGRSETYSDSYSDWSKTNMDSIISSMKAAKLQESQFQTEDETMKTLERMGQSSGGRMQAMQVGLQIADQQVRQTQKLRALVMAQMQMQAAYMATEANEKDLQRAESRKFYETKSATTTVGDEDRF